MAAPIRQFRRDGRALRPPPEWWRPLTSDSSYGSPDVRRGLRPRQAHPDAVVEQAVAEQIEELGLRALISEGYVDRPAATAGRGLPGVLGRCALAGDREAAGFSRISAPAVVVNSSHGEQVAIDAQDLGPRPAGSHH